MRRPTRELATDRSQGVPKAQPERPASLPQGTPSSSASRRSLASSGRHPRSWGETAYPDLAYFNEVERGGHFPAWEEPELFATEVRAAFKSPQKS
jgi:hypothetical protein